jgi:hypothetical protein
MSVKSNADSRDLTYRMFAFETPTRRSSHVALAFHALTTASPCGFIFLTTPSSSNPLYVRRIIIMIHDARPLIVIFFEVVFVTSSTMKEGGRFDAFKKCG